MHRELTRLRGWRPFSEKRIFIGLLALLLTVASWSWLLLPHAELRWTANYLLSQWRAKTAPALGIEIPPCPNCNLVLISLDTLRADRIGAHGCTTCRTPNLDRMAARAIDFTSAFSNAWFTTPSHMTAFTSLYPLTHQVQSRNMRLGRDPRLHSGNVAHALDDHYVTLAEQLKTQGYRTYWNGPIGNKFFSRREGFFRGFDVVRPSPFFRALALPGYPAHGFLAESLAPLKESGAPAFLFLHTYASHSPYFLDDEHAAATRDKAIPLTHDLLNGFAAYIQQRPDLLLDQFDDVVSAPTARQAVVRSCAKIAQLKDCFERRASPDAFWHAVGQWQRKSVALFLEGLTTPWSARGDVTTYRLAYEDQVARLDAQMGEFWNAFEATGARGRTLIVVFSDHGEQLFEHGDTHHTEFYEHTIRVPLLILHPDLKDPIRSERLVSLIDLAPTVLEILGLPPLKQAQGRPVSKNEAAYIFGSTYNATFVRNRAWKLIQNADGSEQLFHLPTDEGEMNNLIHSRNPFVTRAYARLKAARSEWTLGQVIQ